MPVTAALVTLALLAGGLSIAIVTIALKYRSDTGKLTTDLIAEGKARIAAEDNMLRAAHDRDLALAQAAQHKTEAAAATARLKLAQSAANAAREEKARHAEARARSGDGAAVLVELLAENLTGQGGPGADPAVDRGNAGPSAVPVAVPSGTDLDLITTLR
jgi:hypothetical protein